MFVHVYSSTKERRMKPILISVLLFSSLLAQNKADDVKTFALKNGMQIIVLEDHSIPNVAIYLFYKVGWRNEYPGNRHFTFLLAHDVQWCKKIWTKREFTFCNYWKVIRYKRYCKKR